MQPQFSGGTWRDGAAPLALRYLFALFLFVVALAARFMLVDILPARGFPFLSFFLEVRVAREVNAYLDSRARRTASVSSAAPISNPVEATH